MKMCWTTGQAVTADSAAALVDRGRAERGRGTVPSAASAALISDTNTADGTILGHYHSRRH
jgi:hypothetical protein